MQDESQNLPSDVSAWTQEELARLPFFEFLVLATNGESSMHPGGSTATRVLFQMLEIHPDDYVLEIGCGSGKDICSLVRKYGCGALTIDYSDFMVNFANRRVEKSRLAHKIKIMKGDVMNLDLSDNQFDVIFAQSVFSTILDKYKVASEISRVLKPSGRFGAVELIWLGEPDNVLANKVQQEIGLNFDPLNTKEWIRLLARLGLEETYTYSSHELGLPTSYFELVRHEGFLQGIKFIMRAVGQRKLAELVKQRTEHIKWMRESGRVGYGIYVFKKMFT